jgi:hypothetical protein
MPTARESLEAEWAEFMVVKNSQGKNTLAENWRKSNPVEWTHLQTYRSGGIRPSLITSLGKQMVEHVTAWLSTAPSPPLPPPTIPVFGVALPTRISEAVGSDVVCTTKAQLDTALSSGATRIRVRGVIDYGGVTTTNGPRLTRRGSFSSTAMLYGVPSEGDKIIGRVMFLGDYWRIRGLDIQGYNCVKLADVSGPEQSFRFLDIDRCRLHGSPSSSILSGWGTSSDIQVWDTVIDQRGMVGIGPTGVDPYCAYMGGPTSRWTFANCLLLNGNGWSLHWYPSPSDSLYTGCTMVGGIKRGGVLLGGAKNVVGVGCIIVKSPTGAFEISSSSASSCPIYDMIGFENKNGWWTTGYSQAPNDNLLTADPLLGPDWKPRQGSPAKDHVKTARYSLLPPYDIEGNPRVTADAGCYAT